MMIFPQFAAKSRKKPQNAANGRNSLQFAAICRKTPQFAKKRCNSLQNAAKRHNLL
jgi:hypothetical protein